MLVAWTNMLPVGRKPVDSKACEASCYATMADVQQVRQSMLVPPVLVIQKLGDPNCHHATSFLPKILLRLAYCPMVRPTLSMNRRSAARPFPTPNKGVEPSIFLKVFIMWNIVKHCFFSTLFHIGWGWSKLKWFSNMSIYIYIYNGSH